LVGGNSTEAVTKAWEDRAPEKIRKNAVHALEFLVTASPEAMNAMSREEQDSYFEQSVEWLKERHGAENVISAVVHRDETTPHLTAMIIPLDENEKLNARKFTAGRKAMADMQTEFADRVGQGFGLERGVAGSDADHQSIRKYYTRVNEAPSVEIEIPDRKKGGLLSKAEQTEAEWAQSVKEAVTDRLTDSAVHHAEKLAEATQRANLSDRRALAVERFSLLVTRDMPADEYAKIYSEDREHLNDRQKHIAGVVTKNQDVELPKTDREIENERIKEIQKQRKLEQSQSRDEGHEF
jgi:hypothetical protein